MSFIQFVFVAMFGGFVYMTKCRKIYIFSLAAAVFRFTASLFLVV